MSRWIALLRGINVSGRNRVPMAELRLLCGELGWSRVETYIQSGNVVFEAGGLQADLERALQEGIQTRFGIGIPVIIRSAEEWPELAASNPFPDAAEAEPNRLMLHLSKLRPKPGAGEAIAERARDGERVALVGTALWIHYAEGAGTSRLSPALVDRLVGSPVTARNWRTVLKIGEMLGQ